MAMGQEKIDFLASFDKLFDNLENSDLIIRIPGGGDEVVQFHAHQNIVGLRTDFFKKAITGGFKEAKDNVVEINEHSAHTVWRFLKYCYTADYPEEGNPKRLHEDDDPPKLKHVRVNALADMLDVSSLKDLAASKLDTSLKIEWTQENFAAVVDEVYSNTASIHEKIREVVVKHALGHFRGLKELSGFKTALLSHGEFSGTLILRL